VSWHEAEAFCDWLSDKTGLRFELPAEAQWEWACRAGSEKDMWYGDRDMEFSSYDNLSDNEVRKFAVSGVNPTFIGDNNRMLKYYAFIPRDIEVNDGNMITAEVGSYSPNHWGLYDMHGNVAEWTKSSYKPAGTEQDKFYSEQMKVVKGGSWRDRPKLATSGSRRYYEPFQKVYNVGFRVIISGQ
jgi:formylglycine-generating enzyme required for sulfatase activity